MSIRPIWRLVSAISAIMVSAGCEPEPTQYSIEQQLARLLVTQALMYENDHSSIPTTNIFQLFSYTTNVSGAYPHQMESMFRRFGATAGFTNSLYEKYATPSQPIPHAKETQAHILFLSGQPIRGEDESLGRIVVWRVGPEFRNCWWEWHAETEIQHMFKEAGVEIPKPTPMPAPPPAPPVVEHKNSYPLSTQIQIFSERFARSLGLPRSQWFNLLACCSFLVIVIGVFLFIWVGRRGRH